MKLKKWSRNKGLFYDKKISEYYDLETDTSAEFLYNPNKMNVAFSRAKSKLIIVGNIEQIKKISSVEYPHIKIMIESEFVRYV